MPGMSRAQLADLRQLYAQAAEELTRLCELHPEDADALSEKADELEEKIAQLTIQTITGTTDDIADAVAGITNATENANTALRTLDDAKKGLEIATALVDLGSAILARNPKGIAEAAVDVGKIVAAVVKDRDNDTV